MRRIEIERLPSQLEGVPDPVILKLIGDNGEVRGAVTVWPLLVTKHGENFRVEVWSGGSPLDRPLDIRVVI